MKLGTKIGIFFLSISLLSGAMIGLLSKNAVRSILIGEVAKRGLLKGEDLPIVTAAGFEAGSEEILLPLLQASLEGTGAVYAVALGTDGQVLAHTNVVEKGKVYRDISTREAMAANHPLHREIMIDDRTVLDISMPVWAIQRAETAEEFLLFGGKEVEETKRLGIIRIGLPLTEALKTVDKISHQIIFIMGMTGGIVLLVGFLLLRRILHRIRLLSEGTEKISQGRYDTRVPVLTNDELGDLANNFNRMSAELAYVHGNLEKEVKARTQELESFVYTVSHDLKSPIVSMHGMASILLQKYGAELNERGQHYLNRIIANSSYMEELIHGLLTLSRIGRKKDIPDKADIRDVIDQILAVHREKFSEGRVEVVVRPSLPSYVLERTYLTQLFQNLITNAAKFMGDQAHPKIEIGGSESENSVTYYVKDNGVGLDPAYHEKIFGVFQRLKDVDVEGTGIGLSVVKKIVDMAGGKVWVESQKGDGATFFVRFPRHSG